MSIHVSNMSLLVPYPATWTSLRSLEVFAHRNGDRRRLPAGFSLPSRTRMRRQVLARLEIDRRHHFEESLRRQEAEEARKAEAEITCPVDCVREVRTYAEFERVLEDAESINTLVVVDFYNSSCGSCKYILPQFIKLCKRGCGEECPVDGEKGVQFIKHNVHDDYDDLTDLAQFYSIRTVPMFSFFVDGCLVEQFPTRDRQKLEQSVHNLLSQYFK